MAYKHKIRFLKHSVPKDYVLEALWDVPVVHFQEIFQHQTPSEMEE
jgi:hypothetical protein